MKGAEFIRRVMKLARQQGVVSQLEKKRGKGSHQTLYFGNHRTIVRDPKKELKTGTLRAMLDQLDLSLKDIMR